MVGRGEGKVAVVSGAGSSGPGFGVGKATSVLFAREGARVVLVDKFEDRALETLKVGPAPPTGGRTAEQREPPPGVASCHRRIEPTATTEGVSGKLTRSSASCLPTSDLKAAAAASNDSNTRSVWR
jgi:NAD(P)-dependent dehydrogenase (short-subunit alcohol dehydrogenase family)